MFAQFGKGGSVVFLLTRYARPFFSRMMNFGGRALSDRIRRGRNLFLEMEYFSSEFFVIFSRDMVVVVKICKNDLANSRASRRGETIIQFRILHILH